MTTYVLLCVDKPNSLELRLANREAHLAYVRGFGSALKLAGPLQDQAGDMAGSLIVIDVEDLAAAKAFNAGDPYAKAGLFDRVEIHPFRATLGSL